MASSLSTRISESFGVSNPIFGFTHSPDAVSEVSNAGGIGILGATRNTPEEIGTMLKGIPRAGR